MNTSIRGVKYDKIYIKKKQSPVRSDGGVWMCIFEAFIACNGAKVPHGGALILNYDPSRLMIQTSEQRIGLKEMFINRECS